jgi:curved DNA-binding protein CbpA
MTQDYYETLQVHPRADAAAIEAAYARLSELYAPARLDGAADELVELARQKRDAIERAYAVLGDAARRAAYDEEQAALRSDDRQPTADDRTAINTIVNRPDEELLDYRPLPPAKRAERPHGFDAEPSGATMPERALGREASRPAPRAWAVPAALAGVLVLIVGVSLLLTSGGGPPPVQPTPTPSPLDAYESSIPQARQAAEQNPTSAQAWIDLGNLLYDSAQIVRESAPDSPIYQQRLGRWLEATTAYSQALALQPDNASARADLGASACFYGAGTGDQSFVRNGTDEVRRAAQRAPDDERVLLSLGHCLVSSQPPQTAEAIESWRRIIQRDPSSPLAAQAQALITKYGGQ